ncbi:UNVERIFIED_CONTAM: hypothetical protein K2H54_036068 [Gekko kuhli]
MGIPRFKETKESQTPGSDYTQVNRKGKRELNVLDNLRQPEPLVWVSLGDEGVRGQVNRKGKRELNLLDNLGQPEPLVWVSLGDKGDRGQARGDGAMDSSDLSGHSYTPPLLVLFLKKGRGS